MAKAMVVVMATGMASIAAVGKSVAADVDGRPLMLAEIHDTRSESSRWY